MHITMVVFVHLIIYFEVFSKTWKKELFYTNLKVNTSGGAEDLFKANSSFFAVPWISGTFSI